MQEKIDNLTADEHPSNDLLREIEERIVALGFLLNYIIEKYVEPCMPKPKEDLVE
jgi:hypothetical protein